MEFESRRSRSHSFGHLCGFALALLDLLLQWVSANGVRGMPRSGEERVGTHQGLHGAVKSVPVVAAELGVAAAEVGITVGLGLLDTVARGSDTGLV